MDIKTVSFSKDYRSSSCSLCSKDYKDFRCLSHEDLDPRKHGNWLIVNKLLDLRGGTAAGHHTGSSG